MFSPTIPWSIVLVLLLAPAMSLAQPAPSTASIPAPATSPSGGPVTPGAAPPALSAAARGAIDERIEKLRSQLGITQAQMPLWSAFGQAMRDNAAATDALFAQRAGAVTTMNAVENMHSYAQIARAYADNTERLATAFDSLYASLSDVQKSAADTLFQQQAITAARPRTRR
jgi:hypothetical protein